MEQFERIDDLYIKGYRIIQDLRYFCFGLDSVLLADFATVKPGETVCDLCCGNGAVTLLLAAKTGAKAIWGLEIQQNMCDLAKRSVLLNREEGRVHILQGDLCAMPGQMQAASFDVVTVNPPYMEVKGGLLSEREEKQIARHEVACTLSDVLFASAKLLRFGGRFFMVHRPNRLSDIITAMRSVSIEPKRLRMVHPFLQKEPEMVLIEGRRGGGSQLIVEAPLIVHEPDGGYTKEVHAIYDREGRGNGN